MIVWQSKWSIPQEILNSFPQLLETEDLKFSSISPFTSSFDRTGSIILLKTDHFFKLFFLIDDLSRSDSSPWQAASSTLTVWPGSTTVNEFQWVNWSICHMFKDERIIFSAWPSLWPGHFLCRRHVCLEAGWLLLWGGLVRIIATTNISTIAMKELPSFLQGRV